VRAFRRHVLSNVTVQSLPLERTLHQDPRYKWRFTRLAGNLPESFGGHGDERDSPFGCDCDHDDLLELRSYDRSARKAGLRVCRQWRGCVSSTPKASILSTVLPPGKRNPPPSLQCCNVSAKSCLRSPSVHSVSLFLVEDRRAAWARAAGATECLAVSRHRRKRASAA
jgi:hypothetical protein